MTIKNRRVGSLTMGLVLILFGIIILISQIANFSAFNLLFTLWPVILICIGIEILLYIFAIKKAEEDIKLKYDVLSILFIGFLLFLSLIFYALTCAAEFYGSKETLAESFGIHNETFYGEYSQSLPGAEKLSVFNGYYDKLTVIPEESDTIKIKYSISLKTSDKAYAEAAAENILKIENGETAYILHEGNKYFSDNKLARQYISAVIYLPPEKTLNLSQFSGNADFESSIKEQIIFNEENQYESIY